jgi:hypothetical protein
VSIQQAREHMSFTTLPRFMDGVYTFFILTEGLIQQKSTYKKVNKQGKNK